jgi:hypothetical protein
MTDTAMALACVLLAIATILFIFSIEPDATDSAPHRSRLDTLLERRDTIYDNLRDLRFEHRAGKFSEADYEQMKVALEAEAAAVLAQMDETTGGTPTPATRQAMSRKPQARTDAS